MDEAKKSGSSWEEAEQVGPYQLHEQVELDEHDRGELFLARHETSGAPALVLKPAAGEALMDWRVRCSASASPGYVALEVEDSRWAVAPDRYSAEALACLFEEVREGLKRMARTLPDSDEPRRWRRVGLAGATVACALAFALGHLLPVSSPPPESLMMGVGPMSVEVPTDGEPFPTGSALWGTEQGRGIEVLARPFPKKPYKGQRLPPCKPRVEVELMGACWVPHELKAPCPEDLYEHQGRCFTASMTPPRPPQALEQ